MQNLDIITLCKKISNEDIKVNIRTQDIAYNYKKNKNQKREQTLIFILTDKMEELIKDNNIINFFVDVTYKIIPKRHRKYKLLTITGVNKNNLNSYLCGLVLIQYETHETFYRVFKYLHDMFDFNPIIVNIDYSKLLRSSLLTDN